LASELDAGLRIPLIDLAIPSLRQLSLPQFLEFEENVKALIEADEELDLFEYMLQQILKRRLFPVFRKLKPRPLTYTRIEPLLGTCRELLSCLANWGTFDSVSRDDAFVAGVHKLAVLQPLSRCAPEECDLANLDSALEILVRSTPTLKRRILESLRDGFYSKTF